MRNLNNLPILMTSNALSRRLNICGLTLRRKVEAGVVTPDAILRSGSVTESVLFDMARLPEIRAALANPAHNVPQTIA